MIIQLVKVGISILLSVLAIILYKKFSGTERRWCMLGMILSTCGDVFMTDVLGVGPSSTYFGAAFFIMAHIVYGLCFLRASKRNGYREYNNGFKAGLVLVLFTVLLLTGLMLLRTGQVQGMYVPLLGYLLFIGFDTVCQFSYASSKKGKCRFLIPAMTLFLFSDFLVFLPMLNICSESAAYNILIWLLYIPAQLLIVLFNSEKMQDNNG